MQEDILQIQQLIAHFANSFDLKDWHGLQACFTDALYTDYSDLRGTAAETMTASDYVQSRRKALDHLTLHHLVSNYEINLRDTTIANCRASMMIWRKAEAEDFTTHCIYDFTLLKQQGYWKISGITQKVLWNEGASSIHKGTQ